MWPGPALTSQDRRRLGPYRTFFSVPELEVLRIRPGLHVGRQVRRGWEIVPGWYLAPCLLVGLGDERLRQGGAWRQTYGLGLRPDFLRVKVLGNHGDLVLSGQCSVARSQRG